MKILAIETSCDETAASVVENGTRCICSTVASSKEFHEKTGGIVPEVAARKQMESILPVIDQTLKDFALVESVKDFRNVHKKIDALAVTVGPGLIGSLIVGVEAAKALSAVWGKPLIPVNHLIGHIYANWIGLNSEIKFPGVVLVVSGGHTDLVLMKGHGDFEYIGGTLDDAAGEAFDKTARLLGLSKYLGGPELSRLASNCKKSNSAEYFLPRPMIHDSNFDFSFSGLKTAVKRIVEERAEVGLIALPEIAREFENAVVDVLVAKTIRATEKFGAKSILLGGGVSANSSLRARMKERAEKIGVFFNVPPVGLCTDNAVYIASAAFFNNNPKSLGDISAIPSLGVTDKP